MRGGGTLQECRRIAERALSCKVRDTEGFEEIVAEPSTSRMATGWDIVWCDGHKLGVDATDDRSSAKSPRGCTMRRLARPAPRGRRPRRPRRPARGVRGAPRAGEASRSEARPKRRARRRRTSPLERYDRQAGFAGQPTRASRHAGRAGSLISDGESAGNVEERNSARAREHGGHAPPATGSSSAARLSAAAITASTPSTRRCRTLVAVYSRTVRPKNVRPAR